MLAPLALALAVTTACAGGLTRNHKQGLAVVGGVAVVMGGTLLVDGTSCDQETWNGADCSYDGAELRNGALMIAGGGALLTWAWLMLSRDDGAPESNGTRTAKTTAKNAAK
ncbi:MAG: hypothetical protein F9K40_04785 [Kofleriaceae bacterium]|nr:MAG: hypothetical protein F9K40_04785 [Kofleriaceae bacterium]MBZ0237659.1 hypothetical protein [Kofleriaceae bacterium]